MRLLTRAVDGRTMHNTVVVSLFFFYLITIFIDLFLFLLIIYFLVICSVPLANTSRSVTLGSSRFGLTYIPTLTLAYHPCHFYPNLMSLLARSSDYRATNLSREPAPSSCCRPTYAFINPRFSRRSIDSHKDGFTCFQSCYTYHLEQLTSRC